MFGTMVDYWAYTGDSSYVNVTYEAMQHQIGTDKDFMPTNQTKSEGNDDQGFWAMAAMTAAEMGFRNPSNTSTDEAQWLALAQAVFNEYASRWDTENCAGGLRWQIWTFNNGYTYKNTISNGCFFNLGARLARYTGNATYAEWAVKVWNWMEDIQFIDSSYNIYDGAGYSDNQNCTVLDNVQWTYNAGIWMHGSAVMYNYTNSSSLWQGRVAGIVNRTSQYFFNNSILYEPSCEPQSSCTTDSLSFKAYLARWMAGTVQMASFTYSTLYPLMLASGQAAALQCSGTATTSAGFKGISGTACGSHWTQGATWDGENGVGQQMSALSAVFYSQVLNWAVSSPYTAETGGTSIGDASAGTSTDEDSLSTLAAITTGDRVGAGILTTFTLAGLLGGCAFMMVG
jgi:mannan endo-1,6-alpha-mannosidase